jgi:hypothetical protein
MMMRASGVCRRLTARAAVHWSSAHSSASRSRNVSYKGLTLSSRRMGVSLFSTSSSSPSSSSSSFSDDDGCTSTGSENVKGEDKPFDLGITKEDIAEYELRHGHNEHSFNRAHNRLRSEGRLNTVRASDRASDAFSSASHYKQGTKRK